MICLKRKSPFSCTIQKRGRFWNSLRSCSEVIFLVSWTAGTLNLFFLFLLLIVVVDDCCYCWPDMASFENWKQQERQDEVLFLVLTVKELGSICKKAKPSSPVHQQICWALQVEGAIASHRGENHMRKHMPQTNRDRGGSWGSRSGRCSEAAFGLDREYQKVTVGHQRGRPGFIRACLHDNKVSLQSQFLRTFLFPCEQQAPHWVKMVMWGPCALCGFAVSILRLAECICYCQRWIQSLMLPTTGLAWTTFSRSMWACCHTVSM